MSVNRNKGKCLFGVDERTPDVYAAVTASYYLGLSALKTKEKILMKYVSLHLNAIKTEPNLMLKHKFRKETQEEMKSEREFPLEKKVIKIFHFPTLSLISRCLGTIGSAYVSCCTDYTALLWDVISRFERNNWNWGPVVLLSISCTAPAPQLRCCHCRFHGGLTCIPATLE